MMPVERPPSSSTGEQDTPSLPARTGSEVGEEARVGATARGRAVNVAILALSKAARSFQLYDPGNDAIRRFLQDLRTKMTAALSTAATIDLEVRPFELLLDGEAVYTEEDRERSLAFRLFRDGVRKLTLDPGLEWEEILRLLEVLSIRYTGVRQNEEDVVTLLWKAGFAHVTIDAVEGFAPEDDEEEDERAARRRLVAHVEAPLDWDLPLAPLPGQQALQWRALAASDVEALRAEESSRHLPQNAVRAVRELLAAAVASSDAALLQESAHFVAEVRDFLLSEGQLVHLTELVRALQLAAPKAPEHVQSLLATFADKRAIGKVLHSVSKGAATPPPDLLELLDILPTDHLSHLVDLLAEERGEASRRLTRQLVERYATQNPDFLVSRLRSSPPAVASDLLRALAHALPQKALEIAMELANHPDVTLASEALWRFEQAPPGPRVTRALVKGIESASAEVRARAAEILARRRDPAAFQPLVRIVESTAQLLSTEEAEMFGTLLGQISPGPALTLFAGWLQRPKGLMGRLTETPGRRALQWTAVSGLATIPGDEPQRLIQEAEQHVDAELRRHCFAVLARRRHRGPSHG